MFLKEIRLKNVRCFDDLVLSFGTELSEKNKTKEGEGIRHWTVILGENGTGKSTLLRAIALVTAGSDALGELLGDPQGWVGYRKKFCEIEATLTTMGGEERRVALRIENGDSISRVIKRNSQNLELLDAALEHTNRNYFVVAYGTSRRLSSGSSRRQRTSSYDHVRARSVATLFDPEATLKPLESWAMDLDYRKEQTGLRVVRKALRDFLPGVSLSRIDKENSRLLMKTAEGVIPLQNLSDGYQNVAAWIGDLLYRITGAFDDYDSPLKARGLLMIDEVDLHLHAKWQRTLIDFLETKLPNFQLIVTTHSPITAQQAREGQLHYLRRENRKLDIEAFEGNPRMLLVSQLLMTDVFGLETDESTIVEQTKNRYRELRGKKAKSPKERDELRELSRSLKDMPEGGPSLGIRDKHLKLLRKVERELGARKS